MPFRSWIMVFMDDLFGYGPTGDPELHEKWWESDIPIHGLDVGSGHADVCVHRFWVSR